MTFRNLLKLENNTALLAISLLIIVLYSFVFSPLLNQTKQLQNELTAERQLSTYLNQAKQQLANIPNYPALSKINAQKQINNAFQAQKIKLKSLTIQNKLGVVSINKIAFEKLLGILQQLKNQHGIVVTEALIKRIDTGVVSAQLTFQIP